MSKTSYRSLIVLTAILLAALIVAACGGSTQPQPTAVPVPTEVTPAAPNDLWRKVQQEGKMLVGTSADYPPFEFYDSSFKLDGFDIALMKEIGKKLGVEVVFKNIAFDGLIDALALGQIDAAIAAITETPARAAIVDFSSPYFASSEGYLVASGAEIQSVDDLAAIAGLRIGVQRG